MRKFSLYLLLLPFVLTSLGCTLDPVSAAADLRAIYNEAQVQRGEMCADPNISRDKCEELSEQLNKMGPFVDTLEVLAAASVKDPMKNIDFHALWVEYRPKVQAILIRIVLRRYLGT